MILYIKSMSRASISSICREEPNRDSSKGSPLKLPPSRPRSSMTLNPQQRQTKVLPASPLSKSKIKLRAKPRSLPKALSGIDLALTQHLTNSHISGQVTPHAFAVAQGLFEQVIVSNKPLSQVLNSIKSFYESWLSSKDSLISSQSEEISALKKSLEEEKRSYKILCKRYKRTAIDNLEVNQQLKDKEELIDELKAHTKATRTNSKASFLASKSSVELLNQEIISLSEKLHKQSQMIGQLTSKIQQYEKLLNSLTQEGHAGSLLRQLSSRSLDSLLCSFNTKKDSDSNLDLLQLLSPNPNCTPSFTENSIDFDDISPIYDKRDLTFD